MQELQTPLTEIEKAELIASLDLLNINLRGYLSKLVRRLCYEIDELKAKLGVQRDYVIGDKVRCLTDVSYAPYRIVHEMGHVYEVCISNIAEINGNKAAYELVK